MLYPLSYGGGAWLHGWRFARGGNPAPHRLSLERPPKPPEGLTESSIG